MLKGQIIVYTYPLGPAWFTRGLIRGVGDSPTSSEVLVFVELKASTVFLSFTAILDILRLMRCCHEHKCRLQQLVGWASRKSSLRLTIHDAGHRHHQLRSPHRIRFLFYFCCPGLLHRFVEHFSANHVWHLLEIPPTLTFIANIAHYMCHHNPIIIVQN